MNIIDCHSQKALTSIDSPTATTIGNFDGCHLGHQELVKMTLHLSRIKSMSPLALSFSPRPEVFFNKSSKARELFTAEQKKRAFCELGVSYLAIKIFDKEFSQISHESFFHDFLLKSLKAKAVIIGDNFRFGFRRLGDTAWLRQAGKKTDTDIAIVPAVIDGDEAISSTRIRNALMRNGDVEHVCSWLGRPYLLEGKIEKGDQLGRTIGFPTANLGEIKQLTPKPGVYAGYTWLSSSDRETPTVLKVDDSSIASVFNIGYRPTVSNKMQLRCEAHLLSGEYGADALYGKKAGFYLSHRLREEKKFNSIEELKKQISMDLEKAKKTLK